MKKILLPLLLIILLSCTTTKTPTSKIENIKVWQVTSYIKDNQELLNNNIENVFFTFNLTTKKSFITYLLTADATKTLENEWKEIEKKIRLDKLNIIYEVSYKRYATKIVLTDVKKDFVLEGKNIKKVRERINNIIYTERSKESEGLIPLLYRIWNPTVIERIPYPELKADESFYLKVDGEDINLSSDTTSIDLKFIGDQKWIGY